MMTSKSFIQNVTLLFVSVSIFSLILVIIAEVYLRVKYSNEHSRLASKMERMENGLCVTRSPNPTLIYTYTPNNTDSNCETNSHGYRDDEHRYTKDAETFRVVVIGDSVAQGYGVTLKETFGKVLERQLRNDSAKHPNNVEVIILARTGYSTNQELVLLEGEAFQYSPDLIIWSYTLNDPANPFFHNANGEIGRLFLNPTFHLVPWIQREIFIANERSEKKRKQCVKEYHEMLHCVYWDQVVAHVEQIGQVVRAKRIPLVFLIHPVIQKDKHYNEYNLTALHGRLQELAKSSGLTIVDALDVYKDFHSDVIRQPNSKGYDPWHPNALGHQIVSAQLFETIEEQNYRNE